MFIWRRIGTRKSHDVIASKCPVFHCLIVFQIYKFIISQRQIHDVMKAVQNQIREHGKNYTKLVLCEGYIVIKASTVSTHTSTTSSARLLQLLNVLRSFRLSHHDFFAFEFTVSGTSSMNLLSRLGGPAARTAPGVGDGSLLFPPLLLLPLLSLLNHPPLE